MDYLLSSELQTAIQKAQQEARKRTQVHFSSGHLLWGLLREDAGLWPLLEQLGKEVPRLRNWAEFRMDTYPKANRVTSDPEGDEWIPKILKEADKLRQKAFAPQIIPIHALEAICMPDVGFTREQLTRFPLVQGELASLRGQKMDKEALQNSIQPSSKKTQNNSVHAQALRRYCKDMTEEARSGKIDPVLGRDGELSELISTLGKRNSPNILLVGDPGVGKTALVGGLALRIIAGDVPTFLKDKAIFELDVNGGLVAGAYKGEVEERLKKVLDAVKALGNTILFVDEIHALLDEKGSVGSGAVNLLKPVLARGEVLMIGATTHAERKRFVEKDAAFERRFTTLPVEEPSEEDAVEMIKGLQSRYEAFHKLQAEDGVAERAVFLAKRYIGAKRLPVSAIEVVDLAMSETKVMNDTSAEKLEQFETLLGTIKNEEDANKRLLALQKLVRNLQENISFLLLQGTIEIEEIKSLKSDDEISKALTIALTQLKTKATELKESINADDITATVAVQSGVPLGKIKAKESDRWLNLVDILRKRVVGQEQALEAVAGGLRQSRVGLKEDKEPRGVFFFTGPTGTGKTELAKAIAEFLFDREEAMIRFDMSEFMQEHSVETLLGAPPSYVGYEEGGVLVNRIRQKPYSVVLFDEIEKAHPSVYKIFLQILEEGKLKDRLDKQGDFSKAVVIFTSNAGSDWVVESYKKNDGTPPAERDIRSYLAQLKDNKQQQIFAPEFLNRRLRIIPFVPLGKDVALDILDIQITNYARLFEKQNKELKVSKAARQHMVEIGYNETFGARPLRDVIKDRIGSHASALIIAGTLVDGNRLIVDYSKKKGFIFKIEQMDYNK